MTTSTRTATLDAERADLLDQIAEARSALIGAAEGLTDAQLGETPTASALCLGGLLKHVASMETQWMRFVTGGPSTMGIDLPDGVTWQDLFAGNAAPPQWMIDHGDEFAMRPGDTGEAILRATGRWPGGPARSSPRSRTCPRRSRCRRHHGTSRVPCGACAAY